MEIHWSDIEKLIAFVTRFPFIIALVLGQFCGTAITQTVKKTYLSYVGVEWTAKPVNAARYRASVRWLAVLMVYGFTVLWWKAINGPSGLANIASIGAAVLSPFVYSGAKIVVGWKFPALAKSWGDQNNDHRPFNPTE